MSISDGRELNLEEFITHNVYTFTHNVYDRNTERGHVNRLQKCTRINLRKQTINFFIAMIFSYNEIREIFFNLFKIRQMDGLR